MKRPVHGHLTYLKEDNRHGLSRPSVRRHGLCPVYNLLCCLIILTVSARSRGKQGERLAQTGRRAVCLWDEARTSPVHSGRRKHSRRPPKMFVAAAVNIRSVRYEPFFIRRHPIANVKISESLCYGHFEKVGNFSY